MEHQNKSKDIKQGFLRKIEKKEKRKLRARDKKYQAVWFGMGAFGVIGWSVMVPTVIGIAVGIWADKAISYQPKYPPQCQSRSVPSLTSRSPRTNQYQTTQPGTSCLEPLTSVSLFSRFSLENPAVYLLIYFC